jgi:hypothetical protein
MILNTDTINHAYDMLLVSKDSASEKAILAADYKAVLEAEVAHFIVGGEVVGKNAEERKAFLENKFAPGYADLRMKERAAELARVQVELAQIEVNRINAILRYMETIVYEGDVTHE